MTFSVLGIQKNLLEIDEGNFILKSVARYVCDRTLKCCSPHFNDLDHGVFIPFVIMMDGGFDVTYDESLNATLAENYGFYNLDSVLKVTLDENGDLMGAIRYYIKAKRHGKVKSTVEIGSDTWRALCAQIDIFKDLVMHVKSAAPADEFSAPVIRYCKNPINFIESLFDYTANITVVSSKA